jgi:hypothetical protein
MLREGPFTCCGSIWGMFSFIPNLNSRWRWEVNFMPQWQSWWYLLHRGLGEPQSSLDAWEKRKIFPLLKRVCLHKHASFVLAPGKNIYNTYWELNTLKKYHHHYTVVTYLMKGKYDIMILSTWICHCRNSHLAQFVFSVDKEFSHDIFGQQSVFVVRLNFFTLLLPVYILCLSAAILLLTVCTKWNTGMCFLQRHTLSFRMVHQQLVADVLTDTVVMKCKTKWNSS